MIPNNDEVICPNCVHQFRAIPINVQTRIAELEAALEERTRERDDANRMVDASTGWYRAYQDALSRIAELEAECDAALGRAEVAEKGAAFHDIYAFHHPVRQVMFRAGLLAARESLARFIDVQDASIAKSIRANWWPQLGDDPGVPRKNTWAEWYEGEWPDGKVTGPLNPSIEALAHAYLFLVPTAAYFNAAIAKEGER